MFTFYLFPSDQEQFPTQVISLPPFTFSVSTLLLLFLNSLQIYHLPLSLYDVTFCLDFQHGREEKPLLLHLGKKKQGVFLRMFSFHVFDTFNPALYDSPKTNACPADGLFQFLPLQDFAGCAIVIASITFCLETVCELV